MSIQNGPDCGSINNYAHMHHRPVVSWVLSVAYRIPIDEMTPFVVDDVTVTGNTPSDWLAGFP